MERLDGIRVQWFRGSEVQRFGFLAKRRTSRHHRTTARALRTRKRGTRSADPGAPTLPLTAEPRTVDRGSRPAAPNLAPPNPASPTFASPNDAGTRRPARTCRLPDLRART